MSLRASHAGPTLRTDRARRRRTGGYRRFAWTARGRRAARVVRRRRRAARGLDVDSRPRTATSGPGGATRTRSGRTAGVVTGCHLDSRAGRRRVRRPARRGLRARGARRAAGTRVRARPADRRRRLRRRGGRPVRRRLRRARGCSPARSTADRRSRADRRRRGRRMAEAMRARRARRRRTLGRDDETPAPDRRVRRAARRAGPRAGRPRTRRSASASSIWPHGRWRFDFAGEANHAGTTRLADRHDPMLAAAPHGPRRRARSAGRARRASRPSARSLVEPNGVNAIAVAGHGLAGRPRRRRARRDVRRRGRRSRRRAAAGRGVAVEESCDRRPPRSTPALRDRLAAVLGDAPGARRPAPATTRASSPRPACRPRCCSSATRPASRTPRPSTPSPPTAWPASTRWPRCWRSLRDR